MKEEPILCHLFSNLIRTNQKNGKQTSLNLEKPQKFVDMVEALNTHCLGQWRKPCANFDMLDTVILGQQKINRTYVKWHHGHVSTHRWLGCQKFREPKPIGSEVECRKRPRRVSFWWWKGIHSNHFHGWSLAKHCKYCSKVQFTSLRKLGAWVYAHFYTKTCPSFICMRSTLFYMFSHCEGAKMLVTYPVWHIGTIYS